MRNIGKINRRKLNGKTVFYGIKYEFYGFGGNTGGYTAAIITKKSSQKIFLLSVGNCFIQANMSGCAAG